MGFATALLLTRNREIVIHLLKTFEKLFFVKDQGSLMILLVLNIVNFQQRLVISQLFKLGSETLHSSQCRQQIIGGFTFFTFLGQLQIFLFKANSNFKLFIKLKKFNCSCLHIPLLSWKSFSLKICNYLSNH